MALGSVSKNTTMMTEQEAAHIANRIDSASAERIANLRLGLLEACDALAEVSDIDAGMIARLRGLAGAR